MQLKQPTLPSQSKCATGYLPDFAQLDFWSNTDIGSDRAMHGRTVAAILSSLTCAPQCFFVSKKAARKRRKSTRCKMIGKNRRSNVNIGKLDGWTI
ncbi:hypothetical protein RB195_013826 [Necator americanus]|uniref:Uncharacterized protein n=1 Tax=Necator americanus TaxID=51031 RepID=A0ABR1DXJ3_NECAM